ncbi:MAG: GWxTD domain-containing protein [Bacteroidales bacterium]
MQNNQSLYGIIKLPRVAAPAVIFLLFITCSAPVNTVKEKNVAKIYNPSSSKIHPAFSVYHNDENTSTLFVKIFPKELLYSQANPEGLYKASFRVNYHLYEIVKPTEDVMADSGSVTYTFLRDTPEQRAVKEILLRAVPGKLYQLKIQAMDLIRREEVIRHIYVDKRTTLSQQNFMIREEKSGLPYFAPYVLGKSMFRILYNNPAKHKKVFVSYYGKEVPLPKPSFTSYRENIYLSNPDSLWIMPYSPDISYQLAYEGIYFFQFDTAVKAGLTVLNFGGNFPRIKNSAEMVQPIEYIATYAEYERIKKATNKKFAVDEFWLDNADGTERARELIRIFYTRVFFSNYYFTSFKPGWLTDRGMIFIIYGPPQAIYVDNNKERWVYFKKSSGSNVTFIFSHVASPYAENHYLLERSESSEGHWKQAIDTWRNGSVFMLD